MDGVPNRRCPRTADMGDAVAPLAPVPLADLLQEFARTPGNFLVRLGEPKALHAQLDTIAGWAVGRLPEELVSRNDVLRDAAVLFILRSCFAPENTHYQVLGLHPKQLNPETLRIRYRSLIRLTHPDMGVQGLPPNAAGIVNRANEVLGDPELRVRYDEMVGRQATLPKPADVLAGRHQLVLSAGWRERWQALIANHPTAVRTAPVIGGLVVVALGLLIWASAGTNDSRMLIVARDQQDDPRAADGQRSDVLRSGRPQEGNTVHRPPTVPAVSGTTAKFRDDWAIPSPSVTQRPAATPAARAEAPQGPEASRTSGASGGLNATSLGLTSLDPVARPMAPSPSVKSPSTSETAVVAAVANQSPASTLTPVPSPTAPATSTSSGTGKDDSGRSPARVETAPPRMANAAPPATVTSPSVPAVSPAPSPTGPGSQGSTWAVDTGQAKKYLTDVLMTLERPNVARSTNSYLADMNVQGSLLQPALQLMRKYPDVNVETMNWHESLRPGVMKVQGTVNLRARNPGSGEVRSVVYRWSAEFWGTRDGTVLASLNLRDDD